MDTELKNNENILEATTKIINILITIDTDAVIRDYKNPSTNSNSPTGIGHKYGFMVATNAVVKSGQGTGDLVFKANVGDSVRMNAVSASNNFDDAILLYRISKFSGVEVFNTFKNNDFYRNTPVPNSCDAVLPNRIEEAHFWFHEASVKRSGVENYKVAFTLYSRDADGKSVLRGCYEWDPAVEVSQ